MTKSNSIVSGLRVQSCAVERMNGAIGHYENMPMQYTAIFPAVKIEKFIGKFLEIFYMYIFAQNIDYGYMLEPPRQGGPNEYPQSMFWSKNKKNRHTPV